jgi:hypothetical protein
MAVERATGKAERLTIDNPMSRFRRSNHEEAMHRIDEAFRDAVAESGVSPAEAPTQSPAHAPVQDLPGGVVPSAGGVQPLEQWPAELQKVVEAAHDVLHKRGSADEGISDEDFVEIRRLVDELQKAVTAGAQDEIARLSAALDDLLFYLADA